MLKRNYIYHSVGALVCTVMMSAMFAGCVNENELMSGGDVPDTPYIQLTFDTGMNTRAEGDEGQQKVEFLSDEKTMHTVDLFFYSYTAGENAVPVKTHHIDNTEHNTKHNVYISSNDIDDIFGSDGPDKKCRVYAVVNVSDDDYKNAGVTKETATISQLRGIKATTPGFATEFKGLAMFSKEELGDEVVYDEPNRKASGTVRLQNLAAKIDLFINFAEEVDGVDPSNSVSKKWTVYEGKTTTEAYIVNGVKMVRLDGWKGTDLRGELTSDDYYDSRTEIDGKEYSHHFDDSKEADNEEYPYVTKSPFYSYPNTWKQDPLEQRQTYLLLKVNWLPKGSTNVEDDLVETYYKIPINLTGDSKDQLLSNKYYRVKINIKTFGGINFGKPVDIDGSWEVLDWGNAHLDADIHEIRWLEITQKQKDVYDGITYQAVMNNTTSVTLSYNTTHSVYLKSVNIQYYNFQTSSPYDPELVSVIAYKSGGKKPEDIDRRNTPYDELKKMGIDENVFTLTDEKLEWFKKKGEEPNGFYIDESNQTVTFYHSVYPLIGDNVSANLPGEGKYYGVYTKKGDKTYSPFFITFTLAHVDKPDFEKTYTIKQYPGIFLTFDENPGTTIRESNGNIVPIGFRVPSGKYNGDNQGRYGVYVNGGATGTWGNNSNTWGDVPSNCLQLGGIGGTGLPDNKNMYVIHVNQLSDDEIVNLSFYDGTTRENKVVKFHLGDPRTKYVNNNLENDGDLDDVEVIRGWDATNYSTSSSATRSAFKKVPAQTGSGNAQRWYHKEETSLRYYYPTAEGQLEEQAFIIAPTLRLSSGYTELFEGRSYMSAIENRTSDNLTRSNARRRCAALQDNGYPAGRWRVPTIGELYFFKMLYKKGVLPDLFGNTRAYWSAQYLVKFSQDNADIRSYPANALPDHKFVRCVYDDWYWVKDDGVTPDVITKDNTIEYDAYNTDGDIREMFVWGDKEKNNPQQQPTGN